MVLAKKDYVCAILFGVSLFLWHLPALTLYPGVNHDEVMLNVAALNWIKKGVAALTPLSDIDKSYATNYYWHPPGHLLVMAAAYKVFGFSIEVTRGVSTLSGACVVSLLFIFLRKTGVTRKSAAVATVLLAMHPLVAWLCRSGRMDLWAIGCGLVAMLLLNREGPEGSVSILRAYCSGLLIGVGSMFHVMLLTWAPAMAVAECVKHRRVLWWWGIALGAAAAFPLLFWISWVFLQGNKEAWIVQFLGYQIMQRSGTPDILLQVYGEFKLLVTQMRFVPFLPLIVVVGLMRSGVSQQSSRQWALAGGVVAFALISVGTSKGTGAYPLYWYVWIVLLAAYGIDTLDAKLRNGLMLLMLGNTALLHFSHVGVAYYQQQARDQRRLEAFFAKEIPKGTVVMGPEDIWYALEHSGSELRIWADEKNPKHDYFVTYANVPAKAPVGFELKAELHDVMPKVFGKYWSHTSCSYRIWVRRSCDRLLTVVSQTDDADGGSER